MTLIVAQPVLMVRIAISGQLAAAPIRSEGLKRFCEFDSIKITTVITSIEVVHQKWLKSGDTVAAKQLNKQNIIWIIDECVNRIVAQLWSALCLRHNK